MKFFDFRNFRIEQSEKVFRVGTDGVLLGVLVSVENASKILEIGTGTGLIALMLAQRNSSAQIFAIDIDENAVDLARRNFENAIFSERLRVEKQDFKAFESQEKWDLVICNPPYFQQNQLSKKDVLARQQVALTFENLIEKTAQILSENGIFSVIIPKNEAENFVGKASLFGLNLFRKIEIKGNEQSEIKRSVLEFSFFNKNQKIEEKLLILEKSPRKYTDEYLELTKDFHVFKEN